MKSPSESPRKEDLTAEYGYTVIYEQLSEGGYQVFVPAPPGIVTYGRTVEEAREMAQDAILCHVRALHKDGEEISDAPLRAKLAPLTGSFDFRVFCPFPAPKQPLTVAR